MTPTRRAARLSVAAIVMTLAACPPNAHASAQQFCHELGATWNATQCAATITSTRNAEMLITLELPGPLLDDPTSGPALRSYYHRLIDGWRATGADNPRDSTATTRTELYPGPGGVQTVIVHETYAPVGTQPNNAYRAFVFDMAAGRRLALSDIFAPGIDPTTAIAAASGPLLPAALDAAAPAHDPGTYPFTEHEWTPTPDGPGYTGSYRAFGLAIDHLELYLPDAPMQRENPTPGARFVWSMDGGTVRLQIPLGALTSALRPRYRA